MRNDLGPLLAFHFRCGTSRILPGGSGGDRKAGGRGIVGGERVGGASSEQALRFFGVLGFSDTADTGGWGVGR